MIVTSRAADRAKATAGRLPTPGGARHAGIKLDHLQTDGLAKHFARALEHAGKIDILVNSGHESLAADLTDVSAAQFARQLANCTGYFLLSRLVRDHAVERGQPASVILLGSMYGLVGSYPQAYEGISPGQSCGVSRPERGHPADGPAPGGVLGHRSRCA